MLQIIVDNQAIDLYGDTEIRVEENFPYFDYEGIQSGVVWHFDVPVTPTNEKIFNYANYVNVRGKIRLYDASIKINGIPIAKGKLTLSYAREIQYRVSVVLNDFGVDFDGINMNDCDGSFSLGSSQEERILNAKEINNGNIEAPFRFPAIYAPEFYGELNNVGEGKYNSNFLGILNNWDYLNEKFIENEDGKHFNTLCPQFFVKDALILALELKKWRLKGNLLDESMFNQLLVHNNVSIDKEFLDHLLRISFSDDSYNNISASENATAIMRFNRVLEDVDRCYDSYGFLVPEDGIYSVSGIIDMANDAMGYLQIPNMEYISELQVLKNGNVQHTVQTTWVPQEEVNQSAEVETSFYAYQGDLIQLQIKLLETKSEYYSWYYDDTHDPPLHNVPRILSGSYVEIRKKYPRINEYTDVVYNKHMPDIEVLTFLNDLRNAFGATIFFDSANKIVELVTLNSILKDRNKAYDINKFVLALETESELKDSTPVKLSFSEEAESNNFYWIKEFGYQLSELYYKEDIYALATKEDAVYKSKISGNAVEFENVSHLNNIYNEDAEGDDVTDVKLEIAPVRMTWFRKEVKDIPSGIMIVLKSNPVEGDIFAFTYGGVEYSWTATTDEGTADPSWWDHYFHVNPQKTPYTNTYNLYYSVFFSLYYKGVNLNVSRHEGGQFTARYITIREPQQTSNMFRYTGNKSFVSISQISDPFVQIPEPAFDVMPYLPGIGSSPYNVEEADEIPIFLGFYSHKSDNKAPISRSVSLHYHEDSIPYDFRNASFNFNKTNSLDEFVSPFAKWQEDKEEITVPLGGIGIWEMLEIMQMNRPTNSQNPQPRWIAYKGTTCLPKQASFIIDVYGNIKEAEIIIVRNSKE
ncbi:hypothetical protein ACT29H_09445 [Thermophagus sp. OGC60D27]|uniref:hypothetical protein n=1 Tax=Thermophagus sp. OGC60D27 TaxID=3458415 RepID=UPI0040383054